MPRFKVVSELIVEASTREVAEDQIHQAFTMLVPALPHWQQVMVTSVEELDDITNTPRITRGNGGNGSNGE